ncbi:hypothetical protein J6590_075628 [Homalodisca vitripennis]|nr:hypothetical protein J6590_075628 [Homalodisca vitripennis]
MHAEWEAMICFSVGKVLAMDFLYCRGILLIDFLHEQWTVNAMDHCQLTNTVKVAKAKVRYAYLSADTAWPHWTKEQFDAEVRKILDPKQAHLHNQFLLHIYIKCSKPDLPPHSRNDGRSKSKRRGRQSSYGFEYTRVSQSVRRGAPGRRELVLGAPPLSTKESKRHHTTIQCGPVCARGFEVTTPSSPCQTLLTGPAGRLHKQNN